jgi:flagellar protein FliS
MLYEAAINHVKKASLAIQKNDLVGKGTHIGKAHDIVNELLNTLDFEVGGNIARDLERLYNFAIGQLVRANVENDVGPLQQTEKLLSNLLDGWRGAIAEVQKNGGK